MREIKVYGIRRRPLAENYIYRVILHRGVKYLLIRAVEAVYFINEEDISFVQIGQHGHKVARLFYRGAGGDAHIHAHLVCYHRGKRRLAKARRAVQQNMVKRLIAHLCSVYKNVQVLLGLLLPDILGYSSGAQ